MQGRIYDNGQLRTITERTEIRAAVVAKLAIWIDLERRSPETDELLLDLLEPRPLAIEDIWSSRMSPRSTCASASSMRAIHPRRGGSDKPSRSR